MFPYKILYILALVAITNAVPISILNDAFVAISRRVYCALTV